MEKGHSEIEKVSAIRFIPQLSYLTDTESSASYFTPGNEGQLCIAPWTVETE